MLLRNQTLLIMPILFLEYVYESINNNIMKNDFIHLLFSVVLDKRLGCFPWKETNANKTNTQDLKSV